MRLIGISYGRAPASDPRFRCELETRPDLKSLADASIALIYVGLGDVDQAMSWLNKAYDARFNPSILLRPAFDPLRSDAPFQELRKRMNLPP
jgi:hypothetical protein